MNSNRNFDEKKMKRFNQDIKKVLFLLFFSFLSKRTSKNMILFCFSNNLPYLCSIIKTLSMKKRLIFIISVFFAFVSCSHQQTEKKEQVIDTIPVMVMQIQKCNRLYTAEAHVHKIITHDDQLNLKGSLFKKDFNIHVPGSNRKVAIPMDATLKAYVDFSGFSAKNVNRQGDKIEPGNYYDIKFLQGNILSYRPRRKTVCYYDLLARVVIDEDIHAKDAPEVITINK